MWQRFEKCKKGWIPAFARMTDGEVMQVLHLMKNIWCSCSTPLGSCGLVVGLFTPSCIALLFCWGLSLFNACGVFEKVSWVVGYGKVWKSKQ